MTREEANRKVPSRAVQATVPARTAKVAVLSEWRVKSCRRVAETGSAKDERAPEQMSRGEKQALILQFILSGHPTDEQIDSVFRLVMTHHQR